jgi:hypothetical protein
MHVNASTRHAVMLRMAGAAGLLPSGQDIAPPVVAAPVAAPVVPQQASMCMVIKNMFDPAEAASSPTFDLDIKEDVQDECDKYRSDGAIKHILVDVAAGHVYVRFDGVAAARKVQTDFHGRWFAGRQINVDFVPEVTYMAKWPQDNV